MNRGPFVEIIYSFACHFVETTKNLCAVYQNGNCYGNSGKLTLPP